MESDDREPRTESDCNGPQVRNVIEGVVGGNSFQAQNMFVLNGLEAVRQPPSPFNLPPEPLLFVNRLSEKQKVATHATQSGSSAPVIMISGRPGVGTSSFAVQCGHWFGETHYPDGALYADLREERADGGTAISAVLARFLKTGGCDVPKDFPSRQDRYRAFTRGKRVLVVLDHVENEAEVRALQPSSAGSVLIATSRHRGQYVTGQQEILLEPLDAGAARELMSKLIGADRAEEDESATGELIELCERVPNLLCLVAGRIRRNPNVGPAEAIEWLRAELDGASGSLSVLDVVTADTYESLSPQAAWMYRMLGCHPGLDVATGGLDALAETVGGNGALAAGELLDHHLLEAHGKGRYRLAPLVRAHARRQAHIVDGDDAEARALQAWSDWYVGSAQAADHVFIPDRNRVFPRDTPSGGAPASKSFDDDDEAMGWLDAERHNLLTLQRRLYQQGRFRPVMQLGEAMWVLYIGALYLEDWIESSRLSVNAAVASGHRLGEVRFRAFLARALMENAPSAADPGQMWAEAERELDKAIAIPIVDDVGIELRASAIEFKGRLLGYRGRARDAVDHYTEAMELFTQRSEAADAPDHERRANRRGVALQFQFIGQCLLDIGDYPAAVENLRRAETRLIDTGHYRDVAKIRTGIGEALRHMGDLVGAHEVLTEAVNALAGRKWFRIESEALWQLSFVANARGLAELERACLERLRERYGVTHEPRLAEVDERLARLSG